MATSMQDYGIDRLSVDEKIALVQEIWDSIADTPELISLDEDERLILERRLADHEANPGDTVPWEEVKADALARFRKS